MSAVGRHQLGAGAWFGPALRAVLVRPRLWPVAVAVVWRLAVPGWWRRWPPLPLPDPDYLRFRLQTAYGSAAGRPAPADPAASLPAGRPAPGGTTAGAAPGPAAGDVVAYLEWCRRFARR